MSAEELAAATTAAPRSATGALLTAGRPQVGEGRRLALPVALSAGAAAAGIGLLATSGYLISRAAHRPQILQLMVVIVAVRALGLLRATLRYGERLSSHDLALRQLARLRVGFFRRLVPQPPGGGRERGGDLLARFVGDVDSLSDITLRGVIPGLVAVAVIAAATLAAWLILPAAAGPVAGSLLAAALLVPWLAARVAASADARQAAARGRLSEQLLEALEGSEELLLYGRGGERIARLDAAEAELARLARRDAVAASVAKAAGGLIDAAGIVLLLAVAIAAVHGGTLDGVLLAALALLLLGSQESIAPLPAAARALRACAAAARRVLDVAERPVAVADPPRPRRVRGEGPLEARGVALRYGAGEPWALDGLDLTVAPGERVALVGPSGAGKTTLAELLVRFRDPDRGRVTLDGVDLRELAQEDVRGDVLLCAQDAHLFNTTIRENLLLARRDASEAELRGALAAVELEGWVDSLPHGLDTPVGADGELVSGGQRRRIALARALLSPARFVVLDEPTAHLDGPLARRVTANVLAACAGRGVLIVTHEPWLAARCDRVVRLQDSPLRPK
ncbi:MAG TPA: thiol reductant ABC exporter subunit CydC [Solirubrobacteraceae bacterium]|nr:thiol reductant ABC exporter subunit CydC [Solirubrobacteraceae bacterium]